MAFNWKQLRCFPLCWSICVLVVFIHLLIALGISACFVCTPWHPLLVTPLGPVSAYVPTNTNGTHTSPKDATSLSPVMVSVKPGARPSLPGVKMRWLYMCFLEWNASQEKVRTFVPETVRHSRGSCVSGAMWTFVLLWKSEVGFIITETPFPGKSSLPICRTAENTVIKSCQVWILLFKSLLEDSSDFWREELGVGRHSMGWRWQK